MILGLLRKANVQRIGVDAILYPTRLEVQLNIRQCVASNIVFFLLIDGSVSSPFIG